MYSTTSPTFRKWIGVTLTAGSGEALFLSEGLGHGFISLEDNSVVSYLLSSPYSPSEEFEINPLDPELRIDWPLAERLMSPKDENAPTLKSRTISTKPFVTTQLRTEISQTSETFCDVLNFVGEHAMTTPITKPTEI